MEQENQTEQKTESVQEDLDRPLTYAEREEIKQLSNIFFKSSSKWQKIADRGHPVPKKTADGKPVVIGINKKIRGQDGKPTPLYEMEYQRVQPLVLLDQLRDAKKQMDAAREAQRQAREAQEAAVRASGTAGRQE